MPMNAVRRFPVVLAIAAALSSLGGVSVAASDEDKPVTCGSAIKIKHIESKYFLSSEAKNLGGGSGQQIVTYIDDKTSSNTLWWLRGGQAAPTECPPATPVPCNSIVRLTHLDTLKNLHTHHYQSPLSRQQEVTAFGDDNGNGDTGDDWLVVCADTSAKYWMRGAPVLLKHKDTNMFLGGSSTVKFTAQNCGSNCPIMNHLEAFARKGKDQYGQFQVDVGVLLSK